MQWNIHTKSDPEFCYDNIYQDWYVLPDYVELHNIDTMLADITTD